MTSVNLLLILWAVLFFGILSESESARLLDPGCRPHYMRMMVNGTDAGRVPWMAYLILNGKYICSGSLITNRFVLTAGHCAFSIENFIARLGEYDTSITEDGPTMDIPVIQVIKARTGDIGLLKLAELVTFTSYIKPICILLVGSQERGPYDAINNFTVTGWGDTTHREGVFPKILQKISCQRTDCSTYSTPKIEFFCESPSQFACFGDSGSPIIADKKVNGTTVTVQFGIMIDAFERCFDHAKYLNVLLYSEWIRVAVEQFS